MLNSSLGVNPCNLSCRRDFYKLCSWIYILASIFSVPSLLSASSSFAFMHLAVVFRAWHHFSQTISHPQPPNLRVVVFGLRLPCVVHLFWSSRRQIRVWECSQVSSDSVPLLYARDQLLRAAELCVRAVSGRAGCRPNLHNAKVLLWLLWHLPDARLAVRAQDPLPRAQT